MILAKLANENFFNAACSLLPARIFIATEIHRHHAYADIHPATTRLARTRAQFRHSSNHCLPLSPKWKHLQ